MNAFCVSGANSCFKTTTKVHNGMKTATQLCPEGGAGTGKGVLRVNGPIQRAPPPDASGAKGLLERGMREKQARAPSLDGGASRLGGVR